MKKKTLIYLVIIAVAIGGIVAYRMWNKPHERAEDRDAMVVNVAEIDKEFSADENAANKKYVNKVLQVSGVISSVTVNQGGGNAVELAVQGTDAPVQCTMLDKNAKVVIGQNVTIAGFYSDYTFLGLTLTDCVIKQ